ncbi:MAG: class I SAM-dependent methyltransferase [Roseinatronobacter sp.]
MTEIAPSEAFLTVYSDLAREGPGVPADVAWALYVAGTPARARIMDAGAGSGADTVTLAKERPEAQVESVEWIGQYVDAARKRVAPFGARVQVRQGDMAAITGPYDLIWCAGALYFLGVTEGLRAWRGALADGGRIAFSEACLLPNPSDNARAFWQEYPQVTNAEGIRARVADAGYRIVGERMVIGAPWAAYYDSMSARIEKLRPTASGDLLAALDEAQAEIDRWRASPSEIAYLLMVVAPE